MKRPAAPPVLLDTHALVWYAEDDAWLPAPIRQRLQDEPETCYVSIVPFWELATLVSLQRLRLAPGLAEWLARTRASGFQILAIADRHLVAYAALPTVKDHRDPFDRLLIAQAQCDDLTLVSRDGRFADYTVQLLWK